MSNVKWLGFVPPELPYQYEPRPTISPYPPPSVPPANYAPPPSAPYPT